MLDYKGIGLGNFLHAHPRMIVRPNRNNELQIEGRFDFRAKAKNYGEITDHYWLRIQVPLQFPRMLPSVYELRKRIPRDGNFHVNPDGSLCLGSRLRLLKQLSQMPTLPGFTAQCLVPYLFAVSHKLSHGGDFPFGELAHGRAGEVMDTIELFGLQSADQAVKVLEYLGMKRRKPPPCFPELAPHTSKL